MYSSTGLGLSLPAILTPPAWLRTVISQHVGAAIKGTQLSIPTATGTLNFDLSDPSQWTAIANMLKGITISQPPTGGTQPVKIPVAAAAGIGVGAIALVGLGLYMLMGRRAKA
jgi:hypothetical protein